MQSRRAKKITISVQHNWNVQFLLGNLESVLQVIHSIVFSKVIVVYQVRSVPMYQGTER